MVSKKIFFIWFIIAYNIHVKPQVVVLSELKVLKNSIQGHAVLQDIETQHKKIDMVLGKKSTPQQQHEAEKTKNEIYNLKTAQFFKNIGQRFGALYGWETIVSLDREQSLFAYFKNSLNVTDIVLADLQKEIAARSGSFETWEQVRELFKILGIRYLKRNRLHTIDKDAVEHATKKYVKKYQESVTSLWPRYGEYIKAGYRAPFKIKWVSDDMGWGVFATCDMFPGDFVQEYTGVYTPSRPKLDVTYAWNAVVTDPKQVEWVLDARFEGNEMRFVNHADHNFNVAVHMIVDPENNFHVCYIVRQPIRRGQQLLTSYGEDYWKGRKKK